MAQGMLGDLLGEHIVEVRGRPRVWPWRYDRSGREFWQRPHHQLHTCGEMHWLASPAHESTTHARKKRGREQTTSRELKERDSRMTVAIIAFERTNTSLWRGSAVKSSPANWP